MKLANLLLERRILLDLVSTTKADAVRELLGLLKNEGIKFDFDGIFASVMEREEIDNTSYGYGFAFPHARTDAVDDMYILIGVSRQGLTDKSRDGQQLYVVCLLLTPSTIARLYLQTLSGMASIARQSGIREKILACERPPDLIKLVADSNVAIDKELMVKDVMRHDVASVTPDDTLKEVANRMFRYRLSALAVVDANNQLLGQISDRDLIKAALPDYKSLISNLNYDLDVEPFEALLRQQDKIKVAQLYQKQFEETSPDTRIVEVAAMMIFKDVRRVFVTQQQQLVGVLLRKDLVNMIIRG